MRPGGGRADCHGSGPRAPVLNREKGIEPMPSLTDLKRLLSLLHREQGQTMAEYGIVLAVVTIAAVGVFTALSGGIQGAINNVTNLLP